MSFFRATGQWARGPFDEIITTAIPATYFPPYGPFPSRPRPSSTIYIHHASFGFPLPGVPDYGHIHAEIRPPLTTASLPSGVFYLPSTIPNHSFSGDHGRITYWTYSNTPSLLFAVPEDNCRYAGEVLRSALRGQPVQCLRDPRCLSCDGARRTAMTINMCLGSGSGSNWPPLELPDGLGWTRFILRPVPPGWVSGIAHLMHLGGSDILRWGAYPQVADRDAGGVQRPQNGHQASGQAVSVGASGAANYQYFLPLSGVGLRRQSVGHQHFSLPGHTQQSPTEQWIWEPTRAQFVPSLMVNNGGTVHHAPTAPAPQHGSHQSQVIGPFSGGTGSPLTARIVAVPAFTATSSDMAAPVTATNDAMSFILPVGQPRPAPVHGSSYNMPGSFPTFTPDGARPDGEYRPVNLNNSHSNNTGGCVSLPQDQSSIPPNHRQGPMIVPLQPHSGIAVASDDCSGEERRKTEAKRSEDQHEGKPEVEKKDRRAKMVKRVTIDEQGNISSGSYIPIATSSRSSRPLTMSAPLSSSASPSSSTDDDATIRVESPASTKKTSKPSTPNPSSHNGHYSWYGNANTSSSTDDSFKSSVSTGGAPTIETLPSTSSISTATASKRRQWSIRKAGANETPSPHSTGACKRPKTVSVEDVPTSPTASSPTPTIKSKLKTNSGSKGKEKNVDPPKLEKESKGQRERSTSHASQRSSTHSKVVDDTDANLWGSGDYTAGENEYHWNNGETSAWDANPTENQGWDTSTAPDNSWANTAAPDNGGFPTFMTTDNNNSGTNWNDGGEQPENGGWMTGNDDAGNGRDGGWWTATVDADPPGSGEWGQVDPPLRKSGY